MTRGSTMKDLAVGSGGWSGSNPVLGMLVDAH
jgi:hypothetical protein